MPYLVVKYRGEVTHRLELTGSVTIGRDLSCHVWIGDPKLSRHHCQMEMDDKGRWLVKDLGSRNGIFLQGRQIKGFFARDGETFEIGSAKLTFYATALPTERPRTPNDVHHESLMTPMARVENGRAAHAKIARSVRPLPVAPKAAKVKLVADGNEPIVQPYALPFKRPTPNVVMPRTKSATPAVADPALPTPSQSSPSVLGSMLRTLRLA